MAGDVYIGRGSIQRGLQRSVWANDFKVSVYDRAAAVQQFGEKLRRESSFRDLLWTLSGVRLVCHCLPTQACHGDEIVREYKNKWPAAFDREEEGSEHPETAVLNYLSRLREVPVSDAESSADEDVPAARAGWIGTGEPMVIGSGYTRREVCDGLSLASPGRWPPDQRNYPQSVEWLEEAEKVRDFARRQGPPELLMKLALGQVNACPFPEQAIRSVKDEIIASLAARGKILKRVALDRTDLPIDFRFLELLLDVSGDPEVGLGSFSQGVRVGVGARLPRLPALYRRKKKWRLASQSDPHDHLDDKAGAEGAWRSNYASIDELADKVDEVMEDQAMRGQVIRLSESEARSQFPNLVVASPGAQRKEKAGGVVTARVLFDGTHGISVNSQIRVRDQERSPIAADIKRILRKKSRAGLRTFALTADVAEAHRQEGLALARLASPPWRDSIPQYCRHLRGGISILLLVKNRISFGPSHTLSPGRHSAVLAPTGGGRFPPRRGRRWLS